MQTLSMAVTENRTRKKNMWGVNYEEEAMT